MQPCSYPLPLPLAGKDMRIRDARTGKRRQIATAALICISGCRAANTSNKLVSNCLKIKHHAVVEEAPAVECRLSIRKNAFCLDELDDCECLQRFRFSKADIYRITSRKEWPEDMNATKRRRYRTNVFISFCIICRRLGTPGRWWD